MMKHIISISNIKSGSGRSTIALHLSVALANQGHNVLLVDLAGGKTLQPILDQKGKRRPTAQFYSGLPVWPSRIPLLAVCDAQVRTGLLSPGVDQLGETHYPLRGQLLSLKDRMAVEFIIIDTPQANGNRVTEQALLASDFVMIPSRTMDVLFAPDVTSMIQRLDFLRQERAWKGDILGVVPTFYSSVSSQSAWGYNALHESHSQLLLDPIRCSSAFDEAQQIGKTIFDLEDPGMAVEDFECLARRVADTTPILLPQIRLN